MWSADASNYRRVPIGVVRPRDVADVEAAVSVCRAHDVPVLPVGARTSIAGQAVNTAVVLDFLHLNRILAVDPDARTARVEPGVICDAVRDAAAPHGLTFGPDPSTHNRCTLGGMIGNNACGSHSVAWGKTVDNVVGLDVLTYRGERLSLGADAAGAIHAKISIQAALRALGERTADDVRAGFPDLTRRVSGYNLDQLLPGRVDLAKALVGTEGTCAVLTGATVRLVEAPPVRALAVLGFPDAYTAADHVMVVRALNPLTIEGMDAGLIAALRASNPVETASRALPEGGGWLYVETGGATRAEAHAAAEAVASAMAPYAISSLVVSEPARMKALWRVREDGAGILTRSPDGGEAWPGWEDAAVPPERFGAYLREFDTVLSRHGRRGVYYGHFGDGCLHVRIDFDLASRAGHRELPGVPGRRGGSRRRARRVALGRARRRRRPRRAAAPDVPAVDHPGVRGVQGHLGSRRPAEPGPRGAAREAGRRPARVRRRADDRRHPGARVRPRPGQLRPRHPPLPGRGQVHHAHGGLMCPSFRATGEEMHSTRGRARMLFEMANGR